MAIQFDTSARDDEKIKKLVQKFADTTVPLEYENDIPIIVFQDGPKSSYYTKCSLSAKKAAKFSDLDAKLDLSHQDSFRANRELLLKNKTYLKMVVDAKKGREFNDIIVEYNTSYNKNKPLKVWGGQHRISAIKEAEHEINRNHGFRVYFNLDKEQRTEVALISNTNINVSNDTFDRMVEETLFGDVLRRWCQIVGLLEKEEDFPDVASRSERITVKRARSFIVNFYEGKKVGNQINSDNLDKRVYEPYITKTGVEIDDKYESIVETIDILKDDALINAGKNFLKLHNAQKEAVKKNAGKVKNRKSYRNKAFVESVLCGWSYVAGLLQNHSKRLNNHYELPKTSLKIPDPLNATEMSEFKHDSDPPTYRGLGTRSSKKDRQRIAQLFLAKSTSNKVQLDKNFINKAVSQVVGLNALSKGYTN